MNILEQMDAALWRKGFLNPGIRRAARNIFLLSLGALAAGTVLLPWSGHLFWSGAMLLLVSWNFYRLCLFIQHALPAKIPSDDTRGRRTARIVKKGLMLQSNLRLFITAVLMYFALAYLRASPIGLAAGVFAAMAVISASIFSRR